jgi:hypothetical protein
LESVPPSPVPAKDADEDDVVSLESV